MVEGRKMSEEELKEKMSKDLKETLRCGIGGDL